MYTYHIILDFEMNPVSSKYGAAQAALHQEIIEIGAVKLNHNYEIIDRFQCMVKPQYSEKVAKNIARLTGILNADLELADPFESASRNFIHWIGEESTRIYSWSDCDLHQMRMECSYKNIAFPDNMRRWMNFQAVYPRILKLPDRCRQMNLYYVARLNGIDFDPQSAHRALYDAEVTTELLIPILTGEYRQWADHIRNVFSTDTEPMTFSMDEACGGKLAEMLHLLQTEPDFAGR